MDAALGDLVNLVVCCSLGGSSVLQNVVAQDQSVSTFEPEEWSDVSSLC